MGSQYCQPSDLTLYSGNAAALNAIPLSEQTAACVAASEKADSYMRGRYPLPFVAWGTDITMHVAWLAFYLVMASRGYNPAAGGDPLIRARWDDAVAWFEGVQRQAIHPDVTVAAANPPNYQLPQVSSSPPRGW